MINDVEAVAVLLNIAIGTGWLKLGYGWRCGILLSGLITLLCALMSYYAIWMYIKVIKLTKKPTFEEIWEVLFNKGSSYIVLTLSLLITISCVMFYIQFINDYTIILIKSFYPGLPKIFSNYMISGGIFSAAFVVPSAFIQKKSTLGIISYIQLFCVLFIIIGVI